MAPHYVDEAFWSQPCLLATKSRISLFILERKGRGRNNWSGNDVNTVQIVTTHIVIDMIKMLFLLNTSILPPL